eukprot:765277-Hanusia_phi.AAC.1
MCRAAADSDPQPRVQLRVLRAGREGDPERVVGREDPRVWAAVGEVAVCDQRRARGRSDGDRVRQRPAADRERRVRRVRESLAHHSGEPGDDRVDEGAQGDGELPQGARKRPRVRQRELRWLLHHLGHAAVRAQQLALRLDLLQGRPVPPRRVAAADHGDRQEDHELGRLRRQRDPHRRRIHVG